jgi:hypothetical protein
MPAAAKAPRCFVCERSIDAGEPFKTVSAWVPARSERELTPGNTGGAVAGMRVVTRGVHYSCELEAIAACVLNLQDDPELQPEIVVEGHEDEDLSTRDKLRHLMRGAVELLDALDEVL